MALHAIVVDGIIEDLISLPDGQAITSSPHLSPAQKANAIAVPSGVMPKRGWHYTNNTFSPTGTRPVLTLAQQALAAASGGLTVTLKGSIDLPATLFPTDVATQRRIDQVAIFLNTPNSGGLESFPIKDVSGVWHILTVAQYTAVISAIMSYVVMCNLIADGNPLNVTELPSSNVVLNV